MAKVTEAEPLGRTRPLDKTALVMARQMRIAWQAPMFDLVVEVDMGPAVARRSDGVTLTDIIVADTAAALKQHPALNAHFAEDAVVEFDDVNVGLAVASERGLAVPVIRAADTLSLAEIAERRRALVAKVRGGKVNISDMMGGTFTISNLGMFDVKQFTPIINPPQVSILGVGSTTKRYVHNGGAPVWKDIAELTLTSDHRAVDGAQAAGFLASLKRRLEAI